MANRVSESDLRATVNAKADTAVIHYIDDAHIIVDDVLTVNGLGETPVPGLTENRLKLIEKYLAGHFYLLSEENGGIIREKVGEAEASYLGANSRAGSSEGFKATRFGQQALALDTTNALLDLAGAKRFARLRMIRTEE